MIYIFTALYGEAKPFVRHFKLKKKGENHKFQVFVDEAEQMLLVITGVGSVAAAVAVSSICTEYPVKEEDFLINIGTCASRTGEGNIFLCNKITEESTGRTFYPDILYKHPFPEAGITSTAKIVSEGLLPNKEENALYDMEGAAVYQAGSYFFGPHQMSFLKVVSDRGEGMTVTKETLESLMEKSAPFIIEYLERLRAIQERELACKKEMSLEIQKVFQKVCEDMHCSKTMEASMWQQFHYLMLTGADIEERVRKWYEEEKLPCRDRREGKKRFEEFRAELF